MRTTRAEARAFDHELREEPLRAEIFTPERLSDEARSLARTQKIRKAGPDPLMIRHFQENGRYLVEAYNEIRKEVAEGKPLSPAEEWLFDNFHFLQEQLRNITADLPRRFYEELPAIAEGPQQGFPRVYEMGLQVIAHTDSRLAATAIRQYIHAFQEESELTTGELWGFAIFLRIGLIENLQRLIRQSRANSAARKSVEDGETTAAETPELLLQTLAGLQVSVSNSIISLRMLSSIDWSEIVEETSLVDAELRKDPAGFYADCDFATRDRYRHEIEILARRSSHSETDIARLAIELSAKAKATMDEDIRKAHVGYYLVGHGRKQLEAAIGFHPGFRLQSNRFVEAFPALFYIFPIALLTVLILIVGAFYCVQHGASLFVMFASCLLFLFPASALSLALVNWAVTMFKTPRPLPKLDLKDGIPVEFKTIVVLPTLLTGTSEIRELASHLEIHYLANSDDTLTFALLTDFTDAATERTDADEKLLTEARKVIDSLNKNYPRSHEPRFYLFHRSRKWNPSENKWMGWERKRGKLEEFNRLLLGDSNTSFLAVRLPQEIRYVITLDSDTVLPRDTARKLIGTIAHPLNRARVDEKTHHVVEGYGILQPRISNTLTSSNHSWFARAYSGPTGIDPYTTAVSDIYQDLFGEASFVGKGIYDLHAFDACLRDRFPENTLLSHDLIEGAHARVGLVSDVELFDDHPSDYMTFAIRQHRWVRGDWQVAGWLRSTVPVPQGGREKNTLSQLNQWKLFDNLRRSLVPPFLLIGLISGWLLLPGSPYFWTLLALLTLFSPIFLQWLSGVFTRPKDLSWISHGQAVLGESRISILHSLMKVAFLADEAFLLGDAVVRTLYRMWKKRNLLEWMTAAVAERSSLARDLPAYIRRMYLTQLFAGIFIVIIVRNQPYSILAALPFLVSWFTAPFIAYATGRKIRHRDAYLPESALPYVRGAARDIWRFFETFVTEEDNWLPPDNVQENPSEKVAHRTSPTNIGFLLLSNIAAYDFGYISSTQFVDRSEKTLATLSRLKTFNGHFFNWYETHNLVPMEPRYVSTIDSGNLAASLITLKQFVLHFPKVSAPRPEAFAGIQDTLQRLLASLSAGHENKGIIEIVKKEIESLDRIPENAMEREILLRDLQFTFERETPDFKDQSTAQFWWNSSRDLVEVHLADTLTARDLSSRLQSIAQDAEQIVDEMDFQFLFNEDNGLFSIGFNVSNGSLDQSYYDLLASESRLTSFIGIAKGTVPQSHWFRLSRTMTVTGGRTVLTSWSGSMFEYLMPCLLLRNDPNTLLDETCTAAVETQKKYANAKGVPWGISEAGYNARDVALNYQYGPFGVPALGIKRGLDKDLVIAPYATFLASMVDPAGVLENLKRLEAMGMRGQYGFFESVDFTKERVPEGATYVVVQSFMAHHQGMSFLALNNLLNNNVMQRRFHRDPMVRATELLLQERMPTSVRSIPFHVVSERIEMAGQVEPTMAREFLSYDIYPPRTQLLSNGNYMVMATIAGSGFGQCRGNMLNRWREDVTRDNWGSFIYLKDADTGNVWSAGYQPTLKKPSRYHVILAEDHVAISRRDSVFETRLEIAVSPEEDAEVRRLTIVNASEDDREIDIASYAEIVLAPMQDDTAHPVFNNLFVRTEFDQEFETLLAVRKSRTNKNVETWASHVMMCSGDVGSALQYETDRRKFLGRGNTTVLPHAMAQGGHTNTVGDVLDPIFSLRRRMKIPAYGRAIVAFTTLLKQSREEAVSSAARYRDAAMIDRAFELAATHSQLLLGQLSIRAEDAQAYQRLAGRMLYSEPSLRPRPFVLSSNRRTQSSLWAYGISGDIPICLVRIEDPSEMEEVKQLLRAHEYWRLKGFTADLVILNEYPSSYFQELQDNLLSEINSSPEQAFLNKPGGIFLLRADQMPEEDRVLLRTVARVQIVAGRGSLARQLARFESRDLPVPPFIHASKFPMRDPDIPVPIPPLQFENGLGGFSRDGKEYTIVLREQVRTPAPWINVIANERFGFQISESGAGMTWSENSHENRLTPWSNDPVSDPVDGAVYIRDEESGEFWSATPAPARGSGTYTTTHGAGYTIFRNGGFGLEQELVVFAAAKDPVKIMRLKLRSQTRRRRWLSATFYSDLVLGVLRSQSSPFIVTSIDDQTGALLAVNTYNNEFAGRFVFSSINDRKRTFTCDRTSFLGSNGRPEDPAAMRAGRLSGTTGAGLDPCHAQQSKFRLEPLGEHTLIFLFGEGLNLAETRSLVRKYLNEEEVEREFKAVREQWDSLLDAVKVETPDPSMDVLLNRWLLYQTTSCRFWGRSALYQSGGAYGFRDQLQDSMALVYGAPDLMRNHLLRAAERQFPEGDVQHWWHPPSGRGVRTRSSDDLLWLPYSLCYYIRITGDKSILDEQVHFLEGPTLKPDEVEAYFTPKKSENASPMYSHCLWAIDHSLKRGSHGLPLMGSGDWNDGMNRIGENGRGESVWLAWFLLRILRDFIPWIEERGDSARAELYRQTAEQIAESIEASAWDGEWYLRAFHDDGTAIGAARSKECRIDSIAQSWAALAGGADGTRIQKALDSAYRLLVLRESKMALLFTPAFTGASDVGYIQAYPNGIRENGGQYTHAAAWLSAAFAEIGDGDRAQEIFSFLNPIHHSMNPEDIEKFRVEPYVGVADVYSHPDHFGMGGWSWYTGSASWIYRVGIEWILGFRLKGDKLFIQPCIPKGWKQYRITFRYKKSEYQILVRNPAGKNGGVQKIEMDGKLLGASEIPLTEDGLVHQVDVLI